MQICSDFPAKRLSIFLKEFSSHLFNENYLTNLIKEIKHHSSRQSVDCFIVLEIEIIITRKNLERTTKYLTFISERNKNNLKKYCLFFLIVVVKVNKLLLFFKKYDACAVGAPYFS